MAGWFRPVGTRSASVYWRRRLLVTAALVAGLAVAGGVVWLNAQDRPTAGSDVTPAAVVKVATHTARECAPGFLATSITGSSEMKRGSTHSFTVRVTNSGAEACRLTLESRPLTLTVSSGSDRIWGSADCDAWGLTGDATIEPGGTQEWKVPWSAKRSQSGCRLAGGTLGAGTYVATATLTDVPSARFVFALR
ncbi:hypothetical protein [Propionicicella superfundia]|uniref:hypothetical protein n=1 Tax=Propionicicella superfundia TaxID=348582 RepID=UPI0006873AC3|nr:hypothetical protein [Propionicicella superfundia]